MNEDEPHREAHVGPAGTAAPVVGGKSARMPASIAASSVDSLKKLDSLLDEAMAISARRGQAANREPAPDADTVLPPATQPSAAPFETADDALENAYLPGLMAEWDKLRLEPPQHAALPKRTFEFLAAAGLSLTVNSARASDNAVALAAAVSAATAGVVEVQLGDGSAALDLHVVVTGSSCGLGRPILRLAQACDAAREEAYAARMQIFDRQLRYHAASLALREAERHGVEGRSAEEHGAEGHGPSTEP